MKAEKWFTAFWAALLSFCIAFSGVACLVTGFDFETVDLTPVALWTLLAAVGSPLFYAIESSWAVPYLASDFEIKARKALVASKKLLPVGIALILLWLWRAGDLELSLEALLYSVSRFYNSAYHWGIVHWSEDILLEADMQLCLNLLAMAIAFLVSRTLCRRGLGIAAMLAAIVPVTACLVVTDTPPAVWCLALYMIGFAMVLLTHTVRRQSERRANRLTAALLIPVSLILWLMFYATPPATYQGQLRADAMADFFVGIYEETANALGIGIGSGSGGFGIADDTVSLSGAGPRPRLQLAVMDVTSSYSGTVYLRSKAYDTYNGLSWTVSEGVWNRDGLSDWYGHDLASGSESIRISTRRVRPTVYVPYYSADADVYRSMLQGQMANPNDRTDYEFSVVLPPSFEGDWWKELDFSRVVADQIYGVYIPEDEEDSDGNSTRSASDAMMPAPSDQYTALPENTKSEALKILQNNAFDYWTTLQKPTIASEYEWQIYAQRQRLQAQAIADFVRNSAAYDLQTPRMPSEETDFAIWFLQDSDTGYCVHFASAATVLLRAVGIEARYVEGYTFRAEEGQEVTVREEKAHAWVEYYQVGIGWVVLEATPPEQTTEPATQPPETTAPQTGTRPGVTVPEGTQPTTPGEETPKVDLTWLWNVLKAVLAISTVTGAVLGQRLLRLALLDKRFRKGSSKAQALARWRELLRLSRMLKAEPSDSLLRIARKAKFSQHEISGEEISRLDEAIETLRDRLKKDTLPKRFWYCIIRAAY